MAALPPLIIAITGATGMIGTALQERLVAGGHTVRRVTRRPRVPGDVAWDPAAGTIDLAALDGVHAVVHLAGESVSDRWTDARKREILRSRELGTRLIAQSIARLAQRPRALVSASAIGYYGDRSDEVLDETSAPGDGFLAEVCRVWERETVHAEQAGIRTVRTRLGLVLSSRGGLLQRLLPPFRLGVGGRLGNGRAWMSCVSLQDVAAALEFAVLTEALSGAANVVLPEPVPNAQFTDALARVLHRPAAFTVPPFALRMLLGAQQANEMALASQRVVPRALLAAGFHFAHPSVESALQASV